MKKRAILYIAIAGILWGSSGIFFNLLRPFGFTPLHMTAMRGGVAGIVMPLYLLITNRKLFRAPWKEVPLFLGSGLMMYGAAACYYAAIDASSVSTAVILMYTSPVFVLIYSVLFLREKLTVVKGLAVALVVVGCALVSGITGGMDLSFWGVVLGFGAAITYSAYNVFTKYAMLRKNNSLTATAYAFMVMGIMAVSTCNPGELVAITATDPVVIIPLILGIGLCTCVGPYFLYTLAMRELPAGTASALGIVEPLAATIFSVVLFHEVLSVPAIIGIVLVLGAVVMLSKGEE